MTRMMRWCGFGSPLIGELGREKDGATVIEAALVLPVFFLILFGVFEFAIVICGWSGATYGARAAARYASMHSPTSLSPCGTTSNAGCAQETALIAPYVPGAAANGLSVTTKWVGATTTGTIGTWVVVNVSVQYNMHIPWSTLSTITVGNQAQYPIIR